jgi:hypothetical protein
MKKKIKFADLFEVDNFKNVRVDEEQLKSICGGNTREFFEVEFDPIIDTSIIIDID